jgi:hypothetical protein
VPPHLLQIAYINLRIGAFWSTSRLFLQALQSALYKLVIGWCVSLSLPQPPDRPPSAISSRFRWPIRSLTGQPTRFSFLESGWLGRRWLSGSRTADVSRAVVTPFDHRL